MKACFRCFICVQQTRPCYQCAFLPCSDVQRCCIRVQWQTGTRYLLAISVGKSYINNACKLLQNTYFSPFSVYLRLWQFIRNSMDLGLLPL